MTKRLHRRHLCAYAASSLFAIISAACVSALAREQLTAKPCQEFRLTPEELKAFEGYYQFEQNSNAHLQLTSKDNGLIAKQLWDGKEFFIVPKSSLAFYSPTEDFSAKFSKDGKGKITQVLVFDRDTWKKVDNYTPKKYVTLSAEKLKAFEGKYTFQFQSGTDSYINITAMPDHLILTEQWSGNKVRFQPVSELEFYSQERAFPLKFSKDGNGVVTTALAFDRDLWTRVKQ
jgi:hypothetical protein